MWFGLNITILTTVRVRRRWNLYWILNPRPRGDGKLCTRGKGAGPAQAGVGRGWGFTVGLGSCGQHRYLLLGVIFYVVMIHLLPDSSCVPGRGDVGGDGGPPAEGGQGAVCQRGGDLLAGHRTPVGHRRARRRRPHCGRPARRHDD